MPLVENLEDIPRVSYAGAEIHTMCAFVQQDDGTPQDSLFIADRAFR